MSRQVPGHLIASRVGAALSVVTLGLLGLSGIVYLLWHPVHQDGIAVSPDYATFIDQLRWLVDVSAEMSVPTWFNSLLWVFLAVSSFGALTVSRHRVGWVVLGTVALLGSLDEMTGLHERLQDLGWPMAQTFGWRITYAWVFPGAILAVVVVASLWPLVRRLPPPSRRLLVLGGGVFLFGAVVLETLSGELIGRTGQVTVSAMLVTHLEETFEKLGLIIALMGLLRLYSCQRTGRTAQITFADPFAGAVTTPG